MTSDEESAARISWGRGNSIEHLLVQINRELLPNRNRRRKRNKRNSPNYDYISSGDNLHLNLIRNSGHPELRWNIGWNRNKTFYRFCFYVSIPFHFVSVSVVMIAICNRLTCPSLFPDDVYS